MATDVVMPQMGESIAEGTVSRWIKKVGEKVERDEPLLEISTDKVDAEIPSPVAGTIAENISLPDLARYTQAFLMQPAPEVENAEKQRKQLNIRTRSVHNAAGTLSGGNQQKVVLAKWLPPDKNPS